MHNKQSQKERIPSKGRWSEINWKEIEGYITQKQNEIYQASIVGDIKKVRAIQNVLIRSKKSKLLAVRKVTQDNQGKKTAGVDGISSLNPDQRIRLVEELKIPTPGRELKRIMIPKPGTSEKRPLGIPIIRDRCLQAVLKMAIEPEWESKFEPNSYGFRPGKSAIDACSAVQMYIQKGPKYVLSCDISKCFDKIDHKALLVKLDMKGVFREQIVSWLKCGILEGDIFTESKEGTPQGGVISPLLVNIALHGIEIKINSLVQNLELVSRTGIPIRPSRRAATVGTVRYADDFDVIHKDLPVIKQSKVVIEEFLSELGLDLNQAKTRIYHTLRERTEDSDTIITKGFDYLGFHFEQYETVNESAKDTTGARLGFKTVIVPSKRAMLKHQKKLSELILKKGKILSQDALIKKLNPIIRGWANYYGHFDSNTEGHLARMDHLLYLKLRRWGRRTRKTSGKASKMWRQIGKRNWVFATSDTILVAHVDYSTPSSAYTKVKSEKSPYDGNITYWSNRKIKQLGVKTRKSILLKGQKGMCAICKLPFTSESVLEVDHIKPIMKGGADNLKNLQLLHRHCHDQKSLKDLKSNKSTDLKTQEVPRGNVSE
jgi:RNA-directed DNA polymerase